MKQRLGIAAALLGPRDLLVLDEPTNGLDPQGTREVRHLVRSLAADGTTVFVSSHLLAEVEQICTHVGVMSAGRLVAQGRLDELSATGPSLVRVHTPDAARGGRRPRPACDWASRPWPVTTCRPSCRSATTTPAPEDVVAALVAAGVRVRGFAVQQESLEDRFVALTGEGFEVVR